MYITILLGCTVDGERKEKETLSQHLSKLHVSLACAFSLLVPREGNAKFGLKNGRWLRIDRQNVSATPRQSEICVNFRFSHGFWREFLMKFFRFGHPNPGKVARGKVHQKCTANFTTPLAEKNGSGQSFFMQGQSFVMKAATHSDLHKDRKTHNVFQHKLFAPPHPKHFWAPRKSSCASFPGKECRKGTHINLRVWAQEGGLKRAMLGATKSVVYCFLACIANGHTHIARPGALESIGRQRVGSF